MYILNFSRNELLKLIYSLKYPTKRNNTDPPGLGIRMCN